MRAASAGRILYPVFLPRIFARPPSVGRRWLGYQLDTGYIAMQIQPVQHNPVLSAELSRSIKRLPSIEMQTQAFFLQAKQICAQYQSINLQWNGFRVRLSYWRHQHAEYTQHNLAIDDAYVPYQYRNRGWFTQYSHFCANLTRPLVNITYE
jgi:hypothetical protein